MPLSFASRLARKSESGARPHSVDISRLIDETNSRPSEEGGKLLAVQEGLQGPASASAVELSSPADQRGSANSRTSQDVHRRDEHKLGRKSTERPRRFSLLRFRHASDSALNQKAKAQEQEAQPEVPPLPRTSLHQKKAPKIVMTGPNTEAMPSKSVEFPSSRRPWLSRTSLDTHSTSQSQTSSLRGSRVTFDEPVRPQVDMDSQRTQSAPPPYDENVNTLHVPGPPRLSESSRSTSSGDHIAFTTTTTTTVTTTFWRIPRRRKNRQSLFPLPPKVESEIAVQGHGSASLEERPSLSRPSSARSVGSTGRASPSKRFRPTIDGSKSPSALAASALNFAAPASSGLLRSGSSASFRSEGSGGGSSPQTPRKLRERSATIASVEGGAAPRSSLGGFFGLRVRRESDSGFGGSISRNSSPMPSSLLNPSKSADKLIIPERKDEDTPKAYLERLENTLSRGVVASILSTSTDPFLISVLKAYLDTFDFTNDPMDMAIRKLLMEVELPKETQQIDRVLQAFAERYQTCNPDIYKNADSAYFIAFSLLILHTDVFNKANRFKMQKQDYLRNTQGEGVGNEVLECFYDNITYTPFIHLEDDFDINGEKIVSHQPKKSLFGRTHHIIDHNRMKEPVDPYTLIIDGRLAWLRPSLENVLVTDDPFDYIGTARRLDMQELHRSFFRTGVLQIVSERSRPDAFSSPTTVANPEEATPGVVDIKITKVGTLWRKDIKKKRTRSPWQEWGVILTGSQLYFFRNLGWVKGLINQYEQHQKNGDPTTPVIFKPPLPAFKPDAVLSTDDSVALLDTSYKKHKNAFAFVRHESNPEYFLADSEDDMNDWMAKINYAATFRTSGIRMRGVIGSYEMQRSRGVRRLDSASTGSRDGLGRKGSVDPQMAMEISIARKQVMEHKMAEADRKLQNDYETLDALLRTARHMHLLTPIQAKAREAVIQSAVSLTERIRKMQVQIWKTKCHRDILHLDLEEERKTTLKDSLKRQNADNTERPTTAQSETPTPSLYATPMGDGRQSLQMSPVKNTLDAWELLKNGEPLDQIRSASPSPSVKQTPQSEPRPTLDPRASIDSARSHSPTGSQTSFEEAIAQRTSKELERPTSDKKEDKKEDKEKPSSLPKIRRNLHKPGQIYAHISKKSRDFSGDVNRDKRDSITEEGLTRASSSFTVHGKKASIITFGSEWNAMSPEERLRRHRSSGTGTYREHGDDDRRPSLVPSIADIAETPSEAVADAASIKTVTSGPADVQKTQPLEVPEAPIQAKTL